MYDEEEEEEHEAKPSCPFSVYYAEGKLRYAKGQYRKAVDCFNTALELEPINRNLYVARSKCFFQLKDYDQALADAEAALAISKKNAQAVYQKAETQYVMGNFEDALVTFQRGYTARPDFIAFRLGVRKCEKVITNSIGPGANLKLTEADCISREKKSVKKEKIDEGLADGVEPLGVDYDARTLLKEMAYDKEYLRKLLRDDRLDEGIHPTSHMAVAHVKDGLAFLDASQDFWQQETPLYARKMVKCELKVPLVTKNVRYEDRLHHHSIPKPILVSRLLEAAEKHWLSGNLQKSLEKGQKALKVIEALSEEVIPNRAQVLARILSLLGKLSEAVGDLDSALEYHSGELSVGIKSKMDGIASRALQFIGRVYVKKKDYDRARDAFRQKLELAKSESETSYLEHEIGQCLLLSDDVQGAVDCGMRSLEHAHKARDATWMLNANVLIARADVALGQKEDAMKAFARALELAEEKKEMSKADAIKEAMQKLKKQMMEEDEYPKQMMEEDEYPKQMMEEDEYPKQHRPS